MIPSRSPSPIALVRPVAHDGDMVQRLLKCLLGMLSCWALGSMGNFIISHPSHVIRPENYETLATAFQRPKHNRRGSELWATQNRITNRLTESEFIAFATSGREPFSLPPPTWVGIDQTLNSREVHSSETEAEAGETTQQVTKKSDQQIPNRKHRKTQINSARVSSLICHNCFCAILAAPF